MTELRWKTGRCLTHCMFNAELYLRRVYHLLFASQTLFLVYLVGFPPFIAIHGTLLEQWQKLYQQEL